MIHAPHSNKVNHASVSVYCRIRPLSSRDDDRKVVSTPDTKTVSLAHGGEHHTFAFDRIFDSKATQQDVFEGVRVSRCVCDVLGGYNATIFAYGQTASGKTHTMEGGNIFHPLKLPYNLHFYQKVWFRPLKLIQHLLSHEKFKIFINYYN